MRVIIIRFEWATENPVLARAATVRSATPKWERTQREYTQEIRHHYPVGFSHRQAVGPLSVLWSSSCLRF